jgi:hypothetical protein
MLRLLKILSTVFILAFFFSACNSRSEKTEGNTTEISASEQKTQEAWSKSGEIVQKITLSPTKIIRNTAWGQAIESLPEKLELSENQPITGKSYTLYLDNSDLNFADITYVVDEKNKVKEIDVDVFLEENNQVQDLIKQFQDYLSAKMGPFKKEGNKNQWGPNQNTQVTMEDVSTAKDPGIKLIFKQVP